MWFDASLPVEYVPRTSVRDLYRQYVRFGRWKVRYWRRTGDRPRPRQIGLLVAVPAAALGVTVVAARLHRWKLISLLGLGGAFAVEAVERAAGRRAGPRGRRDRDGCCGGRLVVRRMARADAPNERWLTMAAEINDPRRAGRRFRILLLSRIVEQCALGAASVLLAAYLGPQAFAPLAVIFIVISAP